MKHEHISDALNMLNDDILEETEKVRSAKAKPKRRTMRIAVAACFCVAIAAGALVYFRAPAETGKNIDSMLETIGTDNVVQTGTIFTYIAIEGRLAEYEQVYAGTDNGLRTTPESTESTAILKDYIGETYQDKAIQLGWHISEATTVNWYYPVDSSNIKYLIRETTGGELSLWTFRSFVVRDFSDEEYLEEYGTEEKEFFDEHFPGIDLSAYTYGEVYKLIYGLESAEDIVSITALPSFANNTDAGQRIQSEVGTHTYNDKDDINTLYASTVDLLCIGGNNWGRYSAFGFRFAYSFSTDAEDKLTSGEETYGVRYLTITLKDGTTIDSLKYDALRGCFFEFYGVISELLPESAVLSLNDIFGIK